MMTTAPTKGSVEIPEGLTFRGLDLQTGQASPVGIMRAIYRGRSLIFNQTSILPLAKLSSEDGNRIFFLASGEVTVSADIYCTDSVRPITVTTELLSYRKSSFVISSKLLMSGKHVATLDTTSVNIDTNTRKPVPLPGWWAEEFKEFYKSSEGPNFKGVTRKTDTFCRGLPARLFTVTVPRRDQDIYNHVNTVSYLQYCIDALETHLHSNEIDCDINSVSLLLKRAQYLHLGETNAGDMLTVAFWDDENDSNAVCFDISKSGRSVYQARMEFYGKNVAKYHKSNL